MKITPNLSAMFDGWKPSWQPSILYCPFSILAALVLLLSSVASTFAAVRYVDVNSTSPTPPYTNWTTAATTIQDAVDAAVAGDQILVTNGVYQTGGRVVFGAMTNRVAVTKAVTVQSVNGAAVTVIRGFQVPGTTNGDGAIRCVYLTNGAALSGFTLTNGATRAVSDYPAYRESSGGGLWCESTGAVASNCVMAANSAYNHGGGASSGTLNNCTLTGNSAYNYGGGGVYQGTLSNCTLSGNSATYGGGVYVCTLNNCTLTGNSAHPDSVGNNGSGGAASSSTLNNCTLTGNSANNGGGAVGGTLNNCTLTGNSAQDSGGGAYHGTLNNCILYYNTANRGPNYSGGDYPFQTLNYCCTTPAPNRGVGNITLDPKLASTSHLSAASPCRGAGSADYATGNDIDGEAWASPPSIGCDEYYAGAVTRPLSVAIVASYTNLATEFEVNFTAHISGQTSFSRWEFGDGTVVTNRPYTAHRWVAPGDYVVVLRAHNESQPEGISASVTVRVVAQPVHYVAIGSANPLSPYISWATAATNIQDAVDAVTVVGALVLVSNGVFQIGGQWENRVTVGKPMTLRSVNGPEVTVIDGDLLSRCVSLAGGAALVGFTLTNGVAYADSGGGVWCESASTVVSNCVLSGNWADDYGGGAYRGTLNNCALTGNSADHRGGGAFASTLNNCVLNGNWSAGNGGGAYGGTLNNCALTGNSAANGGGGGVAFGTLNNCALTGNSAYYGGGAYFGILNNCTLTGNSADVGGGMYAYCDPWDSCRVAVLNNCIVYGNTAPSGANYDDSYGTLNYCCTTPLPTHGIANFTSTPVFVNQVGGNLRLQSNSPCINSGYNAYSPSGPDLDGNPRIAGGTVDIGAYEFQSPASVISYAWLQQFGLPIDGSADSTDGDGDKMNNWQEWRAGTNPTNSLSALQLLSPTRGVSGLTVSWESVSGQNYFLERGTNLGTQPPFATLATDIIGQPGTTAFTDTNAGGGGPFFYRVGVQE